MNTFEITKEFNPDLITYPFLSVFLTNTLLFIICQTILKKDNSWIDSLWGITFCLPNILILILRGSENITPRMILVTILVLIWGIRLSLYIFRRHKKEDYRYQLMRRAWMRRGAVFYYVKSFFIIFMLQSFFSLVINSSALFVNIFSDRQNKGLIWTDFLGLGIWTIGFLIQILADSQLERFLERKKKGKNEEKFFKGGLWRYSRHPNYFGEIVLWWGIYFICCSLQYGWVTFFSALSISLLIRFVSGVPFMERKYRKDLDWKLYCRETNVFVPWFVRLEKNSN